MKYTKTLSGSEARQAIKRGVDQVADPVRATAGPKGRNGAYREYGRPVITNDGVSLARRIKPEDPFEAIGADLIKQVAEATNSEAGDGTTASVIVAQSLVESGLAELEKGKNPMVLRRELEDSKEEALKLLKDVSREIKSTEILDVARISVEDEVAAKAVAGAIAKAGTHGAVVVEEGAGYTLETEEVKGYFWERGYVSPYFANNDKMEAVLEDVAVIVTDRYMNRNNELIKVLNAIKAGGTNNVLIIVDRMEGELLQSLVVNKVKGIFNAVVVKRPPSDAELEDIAYLANATAIIKDKGIREIVMGHVGRVKRIIVTKERTVVVADDTPGLQERVTNLKTEYAESKSPELAERLAKLTDGVVVLRAGARTDAEMKYLKLKLDDAVASCRAALEEGIVKGGGVALYEVGSKLKTILGLALRKPFEQILANAGMKAGKEFEENDGYNVLTGEPVADLFKAGIIDPHKVARCVIENAVSLAGIVLTLESVTAEFDNETGDNKVPR